MSGRRLITFSLWGDDPKYTTGALRNALLAQRHYPEWTCRFYIATGTPAQVVEQLRTRPNVEVVLRDDANDWRSSVWRFLPAAEPDVEVMLSRDADSRLGPRERAAVDEWLASDHQFHIMRDHPLHSRWPILAGMWGVRGNALRAMPDLLRRHFRVDGNKFVWGVDQVFLGRVVHPLVRRAALVHDEISPSLPFDAGSDRRVFPTPREGVDFVGQVFDADDRPVARYAQMLQTFLHRNKGGGIPPHGPG